MTTTEPTWRDVIDEVHRTRAELQRAIEAIERWPEPSGTLVVPHDITAEQAQQIRDQWRSHTGKEVTVKHHHDTDAERYAHAAQLSNWLRDELPKLRRFYMLLGLAFGIYFGMVIGAWFL